MLPSNKIIQLLQIILFPLRDNTIGEATIREINQVGGIHSLLIETPIIWMEGILEDIKNHGIDSISERERCIIESLLDFIAKQNLYAGSDEEIIKELEERCER